jgi:hypothetical protein
MGRVVPVTRRICARCDQPTLTGRHRYCAEHVRGWKLARLARRDRRPLSVEEQEERLRRERERERRRIRPPAAARGYGAEHRLLRKRLQALVATGEVACARCARLIFPGEPWDLGHDDYDRTVYAGPEHRRCNRATSKRRRHSRRW